MRTECLLAFYVRITHSVGFNRIVIYSVGRCFCNLKTNGLALTALHAAFKLWICVSFFKRAAGPPPGWFLSAIDALITNGLGEEAADAIREKLGEGDSYRLAVQTNATSIARRFKHLLVSR